ncbi:MAG: type II toxin-antitoxin system HicB family antitoxin [Actinomycetota bacterium]
MSKRSCTAVCRRVGSWWAVDVPEIRGVHTQALRLDQVEAMTREAIALLREVPADSFTVTVVPQASKARQGRDRAG